MVCTIESLLHCTLVCYTAGNVYHENRRLIRLLTLTPSDLFNDEVSFHFCRSNQHFLKIPAIIFKIERMMLQLRQTQPALTGKQLFTVKHSLFLQVSKQNYST